MKVKDLLNILNNADPESRVIIDNSEKDYEIEEVEIEKDLDHEDSEPLFIVVIYPKKYDYSFKIEGNYIPCFQIKIELNNNSDYEFRSEYGLSLTSWKEREGVYWVKLPNEEIKEIRAFKVDENYESKNN